MYYIIAYKLFIESKKNIRLFLLSINQSFLPVTQLPKTQKISKLINTAYSKKLFFDILGVDVYSMVDAY